MPCLLIATKNAHKTSEIRAILGATFQISDLHAHPDVPPIEETGDTLAENAILKAMEISLRFDGLVLSDDSGLEVDALGGAPGVRSARYSGEFASDADNRAKLLSQLANHQGNPFAARFRCVMVLAAHGKLLGTFEGKIEGSILNHERGTGGFGYDTLFVPSGFDQTFAQLPASTKNQLSHRARALDQVLEFLTDQLPR